MAVKKPIRQRVQALFLKENNQLINLLIHQRRMKSQKMMIKRLPKIHLKLMDKFKKKKERKKIKKKKKKRKNQHLKSQMTVNCLKEFQSYNLAKTKTYLMKNSKKTKTQLMKIPRKTKTNLKETLKNVTNMMSLEETQLDNKMHLRKPTWRSKQDQHKDLKTLEHTLLASLSLKRIKCQGTSNSLQTTLLLTQSNLKEKDLIVDSFP